MTRATRWFLLAVLALAPGALQGQVTVRAATLFESYSFKPGIVLSKVSELTIPVGADFRFARRGTFAVSGGFANVRVVTSNAQLGTQTVSSPLDTETRLSWDLIPGKLIVLATGVVPTGTRTVDPEQLSVLGAISSDIIGFAAPSLGSGGNVGGGFVAAVPVGKMSAGFGATYKNSLPYTPVSNSSRSLQPGMEFRVRAALEGAVARRTFLRVAAIVAQSTRDKVGGATVNGVGLRVIGYVSLNQSFGKASVTLYGFDVYRGGPQLESTPTGAALLPKGLLLAGGARVDYTLGPRTTLSPRLEFRTSAAAADTASVSLTRLGTSLRFGVDARQQLRPGMAAVLQAGGVTGNVIQTGSSIPFSGMRAALSIEFTP